MTSCSHEDGILLDTLKKVSFEFEKEISLKENAVVQLYEGLSLIKEVALTVSEDNSNVAIADFGEELLYATHTYKLVVPENSVYAKGKEDGGNAYISNTLEGNYYYHFGVKKVTPTDGSEVNGKIGHVEIYPDFPKIDDTAYGFYTTETIPATLYKGDKKGEKVADYKFEITTGGWSIEANVNAALEEGATYTLVIPEDSIPAYAQGKGTPIVGYKSSEIVLTYHAAYLPAKVSGSSVAKKSELNSLGVVAFYTDKEATATDGAKMKLYKDNAAIDSAAVFVLGTRVLADFTVAKTHAPKALEEGASYKLVLPAGSLVRSVANVGNAEASVSFTGLKPAEAAKPEYVTATLSIGGYAAASAKVAKDSAATLTITPADGWTLATLTLNEANVLADYADGKYTTPKLTADATVAATFSYTGYAYEESSETTGVITAGDTGLKAEIGQGYVKITGVKSGDELKAYTLGGALIATETVSSGNTAKLTLPTGTYIVKVNQTAFKVNVR